MLNQFHYQGPATRIVFGDGVAARLGKEASALGMRRALVVTDAALAASSACQAALAALAAADVACEVWADVVLDPTDTSVEAAAAYYRAVDADGLVALGGGSAMDTAKALGVLIAADAQEIAPFYFGGSAMPRGMPPLICLPTTAGTGSEVTFVAIVSDSANGHRKMLVRHPSLAPTVALVDPLLSATMPPNLTASTGLDALSHALEALTATMASPLSDMLALDAIPRVATYLPRAVAEGADVEARRQMSYAATIAGMAFLSGRVHLGHAVGHSLGAAYHLPHGLACIVCMPALLRFIAPSCSEQMDQVARVLGLPDGTRVPDAVADVMERCRVPRLGVLINGGHEAIPALVAHVQGEDRLIGLSRRKPSADDWATIFAESL
jgi:alcohol dehydrogenase